MSTSKRYKWAPGSRIKISAQAAGQRFDELRAKHGTLTAKIVLADARQKSSPLHDAFIWDDETAAEVYRINQATRLLSCIQVVVKFSKKEPPGPIRAFLNVRRDGRREYAPLAKVMNDQEMREQILRRAYDELQDWAEKYRRLSEFAKVFKAIQQVRLPAAVKKAA